MNQKKKKLIPSLILWPFFVLLTISLLIDSYVRPLFRKIGNIILFATGLISILLCYLWIFPNHTIFRYNIDLLWVNPLLLLVAFFNPLKTQLKYHKLKKVILLITAIAVALGIFISMIIEKNLNLMAVGMIVLIVTADKLKKLRSQFSSTR